MSFLARILTKYVDIHDICSRFHSIDFALTQMCWRLRCHRSVTRTDLIMIVGIRVYGLARETLSRVD